MFKRCCLFINKEEKDIWIKMADKAKKFKWNDASTKDAVDTYVGAGKTVESVDAIAAKYAISNRSVIGKLVSEKVYEAPAKPEAKPKADEGPTKKEILKALKDSGKINLDGADGASKGFLTELAGKLGVSLPA